VVNNGPTITAGLAGLTVVMGTLAYRTAMARRPGPYLPAGHALAGPRAVDPLPDVLRLGLGGLTVPVAPGPHGELFLGPGGPQPGRTLRRLVLTPLFARAKTRGGRLTRDQQVPFRLVIEFAGANREEETLLRAYRMLDQQLRDHAALLSHCDAGTLTPGAVTVSIAGIVDVRELLVTQRRRYAFVDGTFDDVGSRTAPRTLAPMISEPWTRRFGWDGRDEFPPEERHLLHALIRSAHDDGRTVRITGLPDGPARARRAVWRELGAAGVDVIADSDRRGLVRHLRRHPITRPAPSGTLTTRAVRRTSPRPHPPRPEAQHEPA